MGLRFKKEEFIKKERLKEIEIIKKDIDVTQFDIDIVGEHVIMMPNFEEELSKSKEIGIKKEWLEEWKPENTSN